MDKKTLNQLIGKYDKRELLELISYIVCRSNASQQALLDYCQKKEKNKKTDNQEFIIETQMKRHWEKAAKIIEMFDMYGGGPESDEEDAYDELEALEKLVNDNNISWIARKSILDELLAFVSSDNSGFTDYLVDIALTMCVQKNEKLYLADYLVQYANSYYRNLGTRIYLENGENEKFLENKKANLQYGSDYLELAEYYKKNGNEQQALEIVTEGLKKADGRLDELYTYLFNYYKKNKNTEALEKLYKDSEKRKWNQDTIARLMYQYYKDEGDYEKKKSALLKLFHCDEIKNLQKIYLECKQELTNEDFETEENGILQVIKKRNLPVYFDILLEKDRTEEVITYLSEHRQYNGWGIDQGHYFTKRLSDKYPREVIEMYWKEVEFYVGMGKEKNYHHAVMVLKEIRTIMKRNKWKEEWNSRYEDFRRKHSRKKLLLKELEGFH